MLRPAAAAALPVLVVLAGCGGSPDAPPPPPAPLPPSDRVVDLRTADARTPLVVAGPGSWRCATDGRVQLAISAEGEASLTIDGRMLASIAPTRSVVHRICDRAAPPLRASSGAGARVQVGAVLIRCDVPGDVLVGFQRGDLTVRDPDGRFVAAAAVRADRVGVAGYLGAGCSTA